MALVPTDKREDRLLERLTLAEGARRRDGARARRRGRGARRRGARPRRSRARRGARCATRARAGRRAAALADATAERKRLRDEVEDARCGAGWRLKYEGSLSSCNEAERARRAADARAATD